MKIPPPPILLTSSVIAMDSSVLLKSRDSRILHTLESLQRWEKICPKNKFIICDGSDFDFTEIVARDFPALDIECIRFMNNSSLVEKYGKGYGESEIVRYALTHSQFLKKSDYFAKCTAKLWVDNYTSCIKEWNGVFLCKAYFANVFSFKRVKLEYIDTRFYIADKAFYLEKLANPYSSMTFNASRSIEEIFLKIALDIKLKGFLFRSPPNISGVGGGSGKYYRNSMLRKIKEWVRFKIVSNMHRYQDLFS